MQPLLAIEGLSVTVAGEEASGDRKANAWTLVEVVRDVSLEVRPGEFVGLVGESGSGKTMTALATLRLLPAAARIGGGRVLLDGLELTSADERTLRQVRGGRIGMVFQEPMSALNPVLTIGTQIREAIRAHNRVSRSAATAEARRLLELVAMPNAGERLREYPHQLSGGQRQRALIAMALAAGPDLLIADEPTTALDVTVQAQILELLESLRRELGLAVLLITHDLAVVAETCDRVVVMYAGQIVEHGTVARVFEGPAHPYTQGLLETLPRLGEVDRDRPLAVIPGQVPIPGELPSGCAFHPRCGQALERCSTDAPDFRPAAGGGESRCFLLEER